MCIVCGQKRDSEHHWEGCKCKCGKTRHQGHAWQDDKCTVCAAVLSKELGTVFYSAVGGVAFFGLDKLSSRRSGGHATSPEELSDLWDICDAARCSQDMDTVVEDAGVACAREILSFIRMFGMMLQLQKGQVPTFNVNATEEGIRSVGSHLAPVICGVVMTQQITKQALLASIEEVFAQIGEEFGVRVTKRE